MALAGYSSAVWGLTVQLTDPPLPGAALGGVGLAVPGQHLPLMFFGDRPSLGVLT